jgi:VanZ family protein
MIPSEPLFPIVEFDKIVHISLFGGFVFLWNLYVSSRGFSTRKMLRIFFFVFVLANSYGIGMEYIQKYYIPMRDFSEGDIIADMMGAGLGYGISNIFLLKKG